MADVVKETHYHDSDAPARSGSQIVTAIVVIVIVLLALLFFSRGFGGGAESGSSTTSTPNVEVDGGVSGSASGSLE